MTVLERFASSLTVGGKVAVAVVFALAALAAAIALTALVLSLGWALLLWGAAFVALLAATVLLPVGTAGLAARPRPEADYAAALARIAAERNERRVALNPLCEPLVLVHGRRTRRAIVLLHGVSSCPRAFVDFAPILHARGDTVIAPVMPENGHADRASDALRDLTAEKLAAWADAAVDVAAGLGEEVIVLGISAGGTAAAWAAQNRPEVARVVLVAPFFGLGRFGVRGNMLLMRAMLLIPPVSVWKDPILRERYEGMPHAYKRQSTRATGEIMRLGLATVRQARARPPAAGSAAIVTNAADTAVDNAVTAVFAEDWAASGLPIARHEFPAEHALGHELIDPMEPGSDPALTYPVILDMIDGGGGPVPPAHRAAH